MYDDVCDTLHAAGQCHIPNSRCNRANQFVIPGWNDFVSEAHDEARQAYISWRDYGKPRHGAACELMRRSRLCFKYALHQCKAMEDTARADALAKSLTDKDMISFWKTIKNMNNKSVLLAQTISCEQHKDIVLIHEYVVNEK